MSYLSTARVIRMAIGGAVGGLITFLIVNPSATRLEQEMMRQAFSFGRLTRPEANPYLHMLVIGLAVGIPTGVALILVEELQTPRAERIARLALIGTGVGAVCGAVGAVIAQAFFQALAPRGLSLTPFADLMLARTVGWAIMGIGAGVCPGAASRSIVRIKLGAIGGLIGGGLGGVLFDMIGEAAMSGGPSRAVGFVLMGAAIGAAVGLVEEFAKEYWMTVLTGSREGRSYILSKNETTLGRDELADIPLFGDQWVQKRHARIIKGERAVQLVPYAPGTVAVNSQPVASASLSDGDIITIGKHRLRFSSRRAVGPAYAPHPTPQAPPQPTPQPPAAVTRLEVVVGPHAGETYILSCSPMTIGREPTCSILLARDGMISRRHAVLVHDGSSWRVEDAGSTNGLFVNGQRVTSHILRVGDQIGVGQSVLRAM